jgi:D-alanyl-D-alanine carboxypeptidase
VATKILLKFVGICAVVLLFAGLLHLSYESLFVSAIKNTASIASSFSLPSNPEIDDIKISAKSAIYIYADNFGNKEILFEKNSNEQLLIASLSKLMSAIIVLDNVNLSQKIEITKIIEDWQTAEVKTIRSGQTFLAEDLLKTSLIESNNSAMIALANTIGQEKFVELMNKKANKIGMQSTKFFNETGLDLKDKPSNYSTAQDLVKLTEYILSNYPKIFEATKQKDFLLCDINQNCQTAKTTNQLLRNDLLEGKIIGGKTGETKVAKGCLLMVLKSKETNSYLVSVVLNSEDKFGETEEILNEYGK